MKRQNIWLLMKKEIVVAVRFSGYAIPFSMLFPAIMQWEFMSNLMTPKPGTPSALMSNDFGVFLLLFYLAPTLIPFLASLLLLRSITEERASGGLMITLSSGINPGFLWAAKTLAVFIFCYGIYFLCLLVDIIIIVHFLKLGASLSWFAVVSAMFISPLCALSVIVVMSFINWVSRSAAFISGFLPLVLIVALNASNVKQVSLLEQVSAAIVASCIILLICGFIVSKLSRARILGL